jgi:hypothetical protein
MEDGSLVDREEEKAIDLGVWWSCVIKNPGAGS